MKVRAPLHSLDARGRFGVGLVFSIWRGLNYARQHQVPTNPQSTRQLVIRGLLTGASRAWSGILAAQRVGWVNYAGSLNRKNVFGEAVRATGIDEYVACYVLANDSGGTFSSDAPTTALPLPVTAGAAVTGAASGEIAVSWTAGQGGKVDVWITPRISAGANPQKSAFVHSSYTADATATKVISGLTPSGYYGIRIRQVAVNGQSGPDTQFKVMAKA